MSVEEKAREYVRERSTEFEVGVRVGDVRDAYLAGHAEALRWRDLREELPSEYGLYQCITELGLCHERWGTAGFGAPRSADIRLWRPIGPLPSEAQSEAPEAK